MCIESSPGKECCEKNVADDVVKYSGILLKMAGERRTAKCSRNECGGCRAYEVGGLDEVEIDLLTGRRM